MLELKIESQEFFNEETSEFIGIPSLTLKLEHSLLSISKWESRNHKRFIDRKNEHKTASEMRDYIRCMTLNHDVPDVVYSCLSADHIEQINKYIEDSMSATTFTDKANPDTPKKSNEAISSELVYYWMTVFNIPFECEKWHFNRLMTLIQICSIKNKPAKKMSKGSVMKQNTALNAARRKAGNTRG